jgi:hypothetical protein
LDEHDRVGFCDEDEDERAMDMGYLMY